MIIVGINPGKGSDGQRIMDGGAAMLVDGELRLALAEERVCRIKHWGGFGTVLPFLLRRAGITVDDVDLFVMSLFGEAVPVAEEYLAYLTAEIGLRDRRRLAFCPSHHLSHAYSAFAVSPFDEALVAVFDNEGSLLGARQHGAVHGNSAERTSYYIGRGKDLSLVMRDHQEPFAVGYGEAYRKFTHFLGFPSYQYAGKTMGLAAYGRMEAYRDVTLFDIAPDGRAACRLQSRYEDPVQDVLALAESQGWEFGEPRHPKEDITQRHADLARLIQDRLETAVVSQIRRLCEQTGIYNLCLAGGVALNAVMNRRILDDTPVKNIYVPPAPGDTGQCIGNALYGWMHMVGGGRLPVMTSASYGPVYQDAEIEAALQEFAGIVAWHRCPDYVARSARMIAEGRVVGWFQGGSEIGPRALGQRSILADPRDPTMKDRLNQQVKFREHFRPYAPSVLWKHCDRFFEGPYESPFMHLVAPVRPEVRDRIPAVVHVDGTARLQTVNPSHGNYYDLVEAFFSLTQIPMVLNTSFNLSDEPIVESPRDAVACFVRSNLDVLVVHDYVVTKRAAS